MNLWEKLQERNQRLGAQPFVENSSSWFSKSLAALGVAGVCHKGTVFNIGDRVKMRSTAGLKKSEVTGHSADVYSGPGQTGTIISIVPLKRGQDQQLLVVRYDAQGWEEEESERPVSLGSFSDEINIDYLIKI